MKHLGPILVTVGCALAAAYGARNTTDVMDRLKAEGHAKLTAKAETKAFEAYCKARTDAELAIADGCPDPDKKDEEKKAPQPDEKAEAPTANELISQGRAELAALAVVPDGLSKEVAEARDAWLKAKEAALGPGVIAKTLPEAPTGTARLKRWAGENGLPTVIGLVLVVVGSLLTRKAMFAEATSDAPTEPGGAAPRDFGEMLRDLKSQVDTLAGDMDPATTPDVGAMTVIKDRLQVIQFDTVEPLIEARTRVQARFGIAGFAAIYGPLAGGERSLNRTWSALVDEHWPEACRSIAFGQTQLDAAIAELEQQVSAA